MVCFGVLEVPAGWSLPQSSVLMRSRRSSDLLADDGFHFSLSVFTERSPLCEGITPLIQTLKLQDEADSQTSEHLTVLHPKVNKTLQSFPPSVKTALRASRESDRSSSESTLRWGLFFFWLFGRRAAGVCSSLAEMKPPSHIQEVSTGSSGAAAAASALGVKMEEL